MAEVQSDEPKSSSAGTERGQIPASQGVPSVLLGDSSVNDHSSIGENIQMNGLSAILNDGMEASEGLPRVDPPAAGDISVDSHSTVGGPEDDHRVTDGRPEDPSPSEADESPSEQEEEDDDELSPAEDSPDSGDEAPPGRPPLGAEEARRLHEVRRARRVPNPDLPSTVQTLRTEHGCTVHLVGTAHFSEMSQRDVTRTMQLTQPDVVLVELCSSRTNILSLDEETLLREAGSIDISKIRYAIRRSGVVQGILHMLLLSMTAHITRELGMAPGGEFRAAFKEAQRIPGCQIHLGDRPISITLQRALGALSWRQKVKLAWHMLTAKEPVSKEDVERCKDKDMLEELLREMTGEYPALSHVFVTERDIFLAHSLKHAARPLAFPSQRACYDHCLPRILVVVMSTPTASRTSDAVPPRSHIIGQPTAAPKCPAELPPQQGFFTDHVLVPSVVVGVVGIGHVAGITAHWDQDTSNVSQLLVVPPASLAGVCTKWVLRVGLAGAVIAVLYKAVSLVLVKSAFPPRSPSVPL